MLMPMMFFSRKQITGMVNHVLPCRRGTRNTVAFCLNRSMDWDDRKCRLKAWVRYSVTRLAIVGFLVVARKNSTWASRFR